MGCQPEPKTIDEYLDQVFSWHRIASIDERENVRQELRLHLEALVDSAEASGFSHDEAVQFAFHQFGEPATVGLNLASQRIQMLLASRRNSHDSGMILGIMRALPIASGVLIVGYAPWSIALPCAIGVGIFNGVLNALYPHVTDLETIRGSSVESLPTIQSLQSRALWAQPRWRLDMTKSWLSLNEWMLKQSCDQRSHPLNGLLGFIARRMMWIGLCFLIPSSLTYGYINIRKEWVGMSLIVCVSHIIEKLVWNIWRKDALTH